MTESLQRYQVPTTDEWTSLMQHATVLVNSQMLPRGIKTANQALIVFLAGREVGWSPIMSLQFIDVINNKARINARGLLSLAYSKIPTFEFAVVESTGAKCVVKGRRSEKHPWIEGSFDIETAQKAGLTSQTNPWSQGYARDMLYHKAVARCVNAVAPDVIFSAPTSTYEEEHEEEIQTTSEAVVIDAPIEAPATPVVSRLETDWEKVEPKKSEEEWKQLFMDKAKACGFATNKRESVARLLDNLGVARGKSSKDMPIGAWKSAYEQLCLRYPGDAKREEAAPQVDLEELIRQEQESGSGPPVDEELEVPPAEAQSAEDEQNLRDFTKKSLMDALLECRKAYEVVRRPFLREWPGGSGKYYITDPILLQAIGKPTSVAIDDMDGELMAQTHNELEAILAAAPR